MGPYKQETVVLGKCGVTWDIPHIHEGNPPTAHSQEGNPLVHSGDDYYPPMDRQDLNRVGPSRMIFERVHHMRRRAVDPPMASSTR